MTKGARESPLCFFMHCRKNTNFAARRQPAFVKPSNQMMTFRKALLIINPISGTGDKAGIRELVVQKLGAKGYSVETRLTARSGDATKFAREASASGYDLVIACGGDGTVNETAVALLGSRSALGIIPCGSGNGLARHLGIEVDVASAVETLAGGHVVECDYGDANGRPFFCTFGVGFDAAVSEKFAQSKKRGPLTYLSNTVKEFVNYQPDVYTIAANGEVITERAFLVAVCNASQYGNNAYIAPKASMTDGLLDIIVVHYGNLLTTAFVGIDMMTGMIDKNFLIHSFRAPTATITRTHGGAVHFDGEPADMPGSIEVTCRKAGIRVVAPEADKPFKPIITPMMSLANDIKITLRRIIERQQ